MKIISHWPEVTKHITAFVIGWGLFSVLLGLFFSFDTMEASKEIVPTLLFPDFLKIAALTFLIGLLILSIPVLIWKLLNKNEGYE